MSFFEKTGEESVMEMDNEICETDEIGEDRENDEFHYADEGEMLDDATDVDKVMVNNTVRDILDQNVRSQRVPSLERAEWENPDQRGSGECRIRDDAEVTVHYKSSGEDVTYTGEEFNARMMERYGTDTVEYSHREPDFEPFEQEFDQEDFNEFLKEKYGENATSIQDSVEGHVTIDQMGTERSGSEGTFDRASQEVADKLGVQREDVDDYMTSRDLTWHECGDRETVRAVPTEVNQAYAHDGGIGIEKARREMRDRLDEMSDGEGFTFERNEETIYGKTNE